MAWFRKLHKWLGLLIGIQVTLWMVSGLMMGLLDHDKVQGTITRTFAPAAPVAGRDVVRPGEIRAQLAGQTVTSLSLRTLLDKPVYRAQTSAGTQLFDAGNAQPLVIDAGLATAIARRDYAGAAEVAAVSPVEAPSMEIRRHSGPAWQVDFADEHETSIYVSAADGSILERRNATWRLFDIFWMLHIMDYEGRENFNNVLVIFIGLLAAFFSITGLVLLFESFGREDFLALLPAGLGLGRTRVTVQGPAGEIVSRFQATRGQRVYDALSHAGLTLPSNCGGGGTCGLCEVQLAPDAGLSDADRRLLPQARLSSGARLSCQARVTDNLAVTVSRESLEAKHRVATVDAVRCVTPYIREISLVVDNDAFDYRAGSYIHVIVPPHRFRVADLDVPADLRRRWGAGAESLESFSVEEQRRAYSLASPAAEFPGRLVLNVRLMLPPQEATDAPAGAGSAWMWSLAPGDRVEFVGPLGEFQASDSNRDLIVLGGGAGMAPLRAIVRDQLLQKGTSRRIDYWYGARTLADLYYDEEFAELADQHDNFHWQPVLSSPELADRWTGPLGNVHAAAHGGLLKDRENLADCEFCLCGPPAMLQASRELLRELGVPDERVSFDDFGI